MRAVALVCAAIAAVPCAFYGQAGPAEAGHYVRSKGPAKAGHYVRSKGPAEAGHYVRSKGPAEAGHYARSKSDAEAAPACLDPPPTDDALVRRAADWMLPDRTIEIPEFETGSVDVGHSTRAHVTQAGAGLSLMPISRSVAHPRAPRPGSGQAGDFSISSTMNLSATLRVEYTTASGSGACELAVQGPFAVRAAVMVDRSQPFEDRVQPLTVNQVNDSGLRLQGCGAVTGVAGFGAEVRDHLAMLAVTEIFVPACRPCESPALQACATP